MKTYYVYILASENKTLYIWVTSDLIRRIQEHRIEITDKAFTKRYNAKRLVYYEETNDSVSTIEREKQLKNWHRQWKLNLITEFNPAWEDLYYKLLH